MYCNVLLSIVQYVSDEDSVVFSSEGEQYPSPAPPVDHKSNNCKTYTIHCNCIACIYIPQLRVNIIEGGLHAGDGKMM